MMNGLSHRYHFGESTFIFGDIRCDFRFFNSLYEFSQANRKATDGTPCFAASHLGLFCLPMSHKKDVRLKRVKQMQNILCFYTCTLTKASCYEVIWLSLEQTVMGIPIPTSFKAAVYQVHIHLSSDSCIFLDHYRKHIHGVESLYRPNLNIKNCVPSMQVKLASPTCLLPIY